MKEPENAKKEYAVSPWLVPGILVSTHLDIFNIQESTIHCSRYVCSALLFDIFSPNMTQRFIDLIQVHIYSSSKRFATDVDHQEKNVYITLERNHQEKIIINPTRDWKQCPSNIQQNQNKNGGVHTASLYTSRNSHLGFISTAACCTRATTSGRCTSWLRRRSSRRWCSRAARPASGAAARR